MIRTLAFHLRIWRLYVAQFLKRRMIYHADFLTGITANLTFQAINILFIHLIFEKTPTLRGWSREEVLFIYGLAVISYGLFHAFFSNIYALGGHYIIEGNLDRLLLRPIDPLFQVFIERVAIEDFGDSLVGMGIVLYASVRLGLAMDLLWWVLLPVAVLCGVLLFLGVYTLISAVSFWIVDRLGLIPPVYNMMAFGRYPTPIYNRFLQWLLSWVVPFAFTGFYPATWFLGRGDYIVFFLMTPVMAALFLGAGIGLFRLGLRRYESAGS